ncbi:hypothetical protein MUP01_02385 [Candidatus Bathyarchaeota archaeon]|nr:hypothetical protein [Candidatus Bathyarchaeota archaeon]
MAKKLAYRSVASHRYSKLEAYERLRGLLSRQQPVAGDSCHLALESIRGKAFQTMSIRVSYIRLLMRYMYSHGEV